MVKITETAELRTLFLTNLRKKYQNNTRKRIHVSDLTLCLRQSFYQKTTPKNHTDQTLSYFVDGARRHLVLQGLTDYKSEVRVERLGVVGTVDMYADAVIEVKTTRGTSAISQHWIKQLGYYTAIINEKTYGYLIIQRLITKGDAKPFEFYRIYYSNEELKKYEEEIQEKTETLKKALETNDETLVPKASSELKWLCNNCLYKEKCSDS